MNIVNFSDTETAFRIKSYKELKRAVFLFKLINFRFFVKLSRFFTNLALKIRFPIAWAVKPTVYKHFVAGETIQSCSKIIDKYREFNVKIILDYSVESGKKIEDIEKTLAETLRTIDNAAKIENVPFVVFKPTALSLVHILEKASKQTPLDNTENDELNNFKNRVKILCQKAFDSGIPILFDAEDVAYQNIIDQTAYEMMLFYNKDRAIVYNTLQMYRSDRINYLSNLYKKSVDDNIYLGLKFVRGAYMEHERELAKNSGYADPIHKTKQDTDNAYNEALRFSVEHIDRIYIFNATHNQESTLLLVDLMAKNKISNNDKRCYFSQLYGMSDNISFNLAKSGFNVAKYTPYGPVRQVLPYLLRRVEENSSVAGQTSRELGLLKNELKRRKIK